jgi:mannose-6-phosphate isomerase
MRHGLEFLKHAHVRNDGLFRAWVGGTDHGNVVDLYDQAFVLLAFACCHARGEPALASRAETLLAALPADPGGGFADFEGARPLRANPNMHMFESSLAWISAGMNVPWVSVAAGQANLALHRLIDPQTGALSEFFGTGWRAPSPLAKRVVEPGHQFEWAWLLMRWGTMHNDALALAAARKLVELGERYGVDPDRNVAINALDGKLAAVDPGTRLWPQTERMRAAIALSILTDEDYYWDMAVRATRGLLLFLDVEVPGLWRDSLESEDYSAPASSFYHIVGAITVLERAAQPNSNPLKLFR